MADIVILIISLFTLVFKILAVAGYNFPLSFDQGRDLLDLRQIVVTLTPKLIGPTTSINGVMLGPFWYYLNLPAFLIGRGDPAYLVYWQIILFSLTGLLLYWYFRRINRTFAFILAALFLFMPIGFTGGRYFWNANAMPFMTALFFLFSFRLFFKPTRFSALLAGLVAGLAFQIEAAFGILLFPYLILVALMLRQKPKHLLFILTGFIATLMPQALFEMRHGFISTKGLIAEFSGTQSLLNERLVMAARFADRTAQYRRTVFNTFLIPFIPSHIILVIAAIFLIFASIRKLLDRRTLVIAFFPLGLIIFSFVFYMIFPDKLKDWYLYGLTIPYLFLMAVFLFTLTQMNYWLGRSIFYIYLGGVIFFCFESNIKYLSALPKVSPDRSNLKNELIAVDYIYREANGRAFRVYSYIPAVYDYAYQYLFWWYGTKKYHYQPSDIAYLPDQPEYINDSHRYWTLTKPFTTTSPTFLIIESNDEQPVLVRDWLGHFSRLCRVSDQSYPWGTSIKKLSTCYTFTR